ncbi:MAG TPA: hypothetical protein VNT28_09285 [Candidatus Limnocylindrales bacterium]|nr:hypothetical protein [Candidatus Limnocylindrales bacterium]
MTRRSLGRGRMIVVLGALVVIAGSLPAWWTVGGVVAEAQSGNAFDFPSSGIVVFLAAVAMLFVVVLPYATRDGDAAIDRPLTYGLLLLAAVIAFAFRLYQIYSFDGLGLPDRSPGLYVTALGLLILCWAMVELLAERPARERNY